MTLPNSRTIRSGNQIEGLAVVYQALHRTKDADKVLARLEAEYGAWAMEIAKVCAFRGEKDQAFDWLERAYAQKESDLYLIKGEPLLKNLEGDTPRFCAR